MGNRIAGLRAYMREQKLAAFCVRDTSNIAYLTGFNGVFDEERAHALFVTDNSVSLHTDSRYANACRAAALVAAKEQGINRAVDIDDALDAKGKGKTHARWLFEQFDRLPQSEKSDAAGIVGIEDSITLAEYRLLEKERAKACAQETLFETSGVVQGLRAIKDEAEVIRLRQAQAITDKAFAYIIDFMKPGMTERQVQVELDACMRRLGADALAFPSIVATGPNGANPHAQPGDTQLEAGQCVVMDFGAKKAGYCSDMTRMVFLGKPDAQLERAYDVLRQANEHVEASLRPGMTGVQAHQMALDVLEQGGFGGCMGHGLGHGVGMEVHEDPVLAPRNTNPLVQGNVVTVEPGIYFEGEFGMRLEDFGIITHEGFDVFTQTSHDLVII